MVLALLLWGQAGPSGAQEMEVPVGLQVSLLTRILSFDRQLRDRVQGEVVICVAYQPLFPPSLQAMEDVLASGEYLNAQVGDLPVRFVSLELDGTNGLGEALRESGANHLYLTPMRSVNVGTIVETATNVGVLTLTGVPEHMESGVAVGLSSRDGRPRVMINRGTARDAGARFSSELLQLSEIVRRPYGTPDE